MEKARLRRRKMSRLRLALLVSWRSCSRQGRRVKGNSSRRDRKGRNRDFRAWRLRPSAVRTLLPSLCFVVLISLTYSALYRDFLPLRPRRAVRDHREGHPGIGRLPHSVRLLSRLLVTPTDNATRRYTQRLSPIAISCHAMNLEQVERDSTAFIEKYFADYVARTGKTTLTVRFPPPLATALILLTLAR